MPNDEWLRAFHFPARSPAEALRAWETLKQRTSVGQLVTGKVIAKEPYGVWLDIDVGFPALILVPDITDLSYERCQIGSSITAAINLYNDQAHTIRLWQVEHDA